MKIIIFIIVILLCFCTAVVAKTKTGEDTIYMPGGRSYTGAQLLEFCKSGDGHERIDYLSYGICMGYVRGLSEAAAINNSNKIYNKNLYLCIPDEVEVEQKVKIVVKYLENHPENLHWPTFFLVHAALDEAFPCK